MMSSSGL